jgi:hypothetical protein
MIYAFVSLSGGNVFTRNVEVLISRPLAEVFAFVADARNLPRRDESMDSEELTSPEPIGLGTTVRTGMHWMGREYEDTREVAEREPPDRMPIGSTRRPFPTTRAYRLAARVEGTFVDYRTFDPRPSDSGRDASAHQQRGRLR